MTAIADQAAALQNRFGRLGSIAFEASQLGGVIAILTASGGRAVVALQGAQVLSWVPKPGYTEVLWCSPLAHLGTGKPVRGGIPVCWPWFGSHPNASSGLPAHGLVRATQWAVERVAVDTGKAAITFGAQLTADQQKLAGKDVSAALRVTLGVDLEVELITTNAGPSVVTMSEALHTYLAISDVSNVRVDGLAGRTYLDQLTGREAVQTGTIEISQETDRIYWDTNGPLLMRDAALGRAIGVSSTGSASTVIWNPWRDKAARLGDMPPESYRSMLCIETANVGPRNVVTVASQDVHRMVCRLSCEKS
jgi:glucose-6-phosphate 1-epimerase